jgi:hypothetical protein
MYEKRKAKRLEEKSEITITIVSGGKKSPEEKIMYNQSKDISVLGARIKANSFLPINTLLKIDFTLKKSAPNDDINPRKSKMDQKSLCE